MAIQQADQAAISHVLRRVTFGPFPGSIDRFVGRPVGDVVDWALAAAPLVVKPNAEPPADAGYEVVAEAWVENLRNPAQGLHEKLTWFWHSHFTTSVDKVGRQRLLWRQQQTLRTHALGNFRDLTRAMTTDGAMLEYLDGANSQADAPNENYAREMMELFALGRGSYTEADVRAGARALAGWKIDSERGDAVVFDAKAFGLTPFLDFLGVRGRFGVDELVDAVCNHEACAPFVAGKLYSFLVGTAPTKARRQELADVFRRNGLAIRPLVENILRGEDFESARLSRPRYPLECRTATPIMRGCDQALPSKPRTSSNSARGGGCIAVWGRCRASWRSCKESARAPVTCRISR